MIRSKRARWIKLSVAMAALLVLAACGSDQHIAGSKPLDVRGAVKATADASGFTVSFSGVEAIYNAPDRWQQIEHGEGSSAAASNGGPAISNPPMPATITKIIIGDRQYENDSLNGNPQSFTVSQRCAKETTTSSVIELLRSIAANGQIVPDGDRYKFTVPASGDSSETSGTLTVVDGYVHTLTVSSAPVAVAMTIESVGHAPTIVEPVGATPVSTTCG